MDVLPITIYNDEVVRSTRKKVLVTVKQTYYSDSSTILTF